MTASDSALLTLLSETKALLTFCSKEEWGKLLEAYTRCEANWHSFFSSGADLQGNDIGAILSESLTIMQDLKGTLQQKHDVLETDLTQFQKAKKASRSYSENQ